jgi:hypothetical protein
MADGTVGVTQGAAPDRLIDNELIGSVYRQRTRIGGAALADLAAVANATPAGTEYALLTRNIPSGTQPVSLASNTPDVTDRAGRLLGHVTVDTAPTTAVTGTFWQATQPVSGTFWQATQPVSIAGTVANNLSQVGGAAVALGQTTMAASIPVALASNQSALPVTGTFWQTTQPVSGTFWQSTQPVSIAATVTTQPVRPATPTQSSVAASATNVTLLAANGNRLGATIYNDDNASVLSLKLGVTASATSFTLKIAAGGYYEVPFGYVGQIDGLWSVASGSARITELTA